MRIMDRSTERFYPPLGGLGEDGITYRVPIRVQQMGGHLNNPTEVWTGMSISLLGWLFFFGLLVYAVRKERREQAIELQTD